ncbi:hypothetical protein [Nostoc sp. NMS7]|nr:hypothetical protein [Nostoc sp. NMS7]
MSIAVPLLISISILKLNLQNVFGAIAAYSHTILDFRLRRER